MLGEKKDNFSLKILPVFPIKVSYKVIGLSNAIWWLFRVGENSVINHRKKKKENKHGKKTSNKLLFRNYFNLDHNIFQTFIVSNLLPYILKYV